MLASLVGLLGDFDLAEEAAREAFAVAAERWPRDGVPGYSGRIDLAGEAIRLGHLLAALMPDEPEVHGLLALMPIHHARRRARLSGDELMLLENQDRSLWDAEEIAAGRTALEHALALRGRAPYVLQAAIASLQAEERIDWNEVAAQYGQLAQFEHALALARSERERRFLARRIAEL